MANQGISRSASESPLFGKLVAEKGWVPKAALQDAVREHAQSLQSEQPKRLGQILVERGLLTAQQVKRLLAEQETTILVCEACGAQYNVESVRPGARYRCKKCQGVLARPRDDAPVAVDDALSASAAETVAAAPALFEQPPQRWSGELAAPGSRAAPAGGTPFGPYLLFEELSRGHSGVVHRATQGPGGQELAVKLLAGSKSDPERPERLMEAARRLRDLEHPYHVAVCEVGQQGRQAYIAMSLAPGRDLAQVLESGGLGLEAAVELVRKLAEVLKVGHEAGLVHGDLAPRHVIWDGEQPRLIGWGMGKPFKASTTGARPVALAGTPGFIAPEVLGGAQPDARADVFSLGALLYLLVAGEPPFAGGNAQARIAATLAGLKQPPSTRNPRVNAALDGIVLAALAAQPGRRYGQARALGADLERWQAGRAVHPPAPAALTRLRLGFARHGRQALVGLAAGVAGLLLGTLLGRGMFAAEAPQPPLATLDGVRAALASDEPLKALALLERPGREESAYQRARGELRAQAHARLGEAEMRAGRYDEAERWAALLDESGFEDLATGLRNKVNAVKGLEAARAQSLPPVGPEEPTTPAGNGARPAGPGEPGTAGGGPDHAVPPADTCESLIARAVERMRAADFREALDLLERARALPGGEQANVTRGLALCHWRMQNLAAAREAAETTLRLAPGDGRAHRVLGLVALLGNQLPEAAEHIAQALKAHPDDAEALFVRGVIAAREDRVQEALKDVQTALARYPGLSELYPGVLEKLKAQAAAEAGTDETPSSDPEVPEPGDGPGPTPKPAAGPSATAQQAFAKRLDDFLAAQAPSLPRVTGKHFRIGAPAAEALLKQVLERMDSAHDHLAKLLSREQEGLWPGQMDLVVFAERAHFAAAVDAFAPRATPQQQDFAQSMKTGGGYQSFGQVMFAMQPRRAPLVACTHCGGLLALKDEARAQVGQRAKAACSACGKETEFTIPPFETLGAPADFIGSFHSAGHFIIAAATGGDPPTWLAEGYANWVVRQQVGAAYGSCSVMGTREDGKENKAWEQGSRWVEGLKAMLKGKKPPALDELLLKGPNEMDHRDYARAWSLVEYLLNKRAKPLAAYIAALKAGEQGDAALEKGLGRSTAKLDSDWRSYIKDRKD